jgi:hypothetical protein
MIPPVAEVSTPVEPPVADPPRVAKRKGHGRRCKPTNLPRRREEVDLSDAEKICACCGTIKIRIGQTTSERLVYQPMAVFVWLSNVGHRRAHFLQWRESPRLRRPVMAPPAGKDLTGRFLVRDQSSFRIVPIPRVLVNRELLLLPNSSR